MTLLQTFFPELYSETVTGYNLVKVGDSEMILEMNVSGLSESDVDVEVSGNRLTVSAKAPSEDDREYLHREIKPKSFKHSFNLRDDIVVKSATVKNGILSVNLELQIPEEKKPRKILLTH